MSKAFDNFRSSNFFGNPFNAWHDGLDTQALTILQGDDLAKAEVLLLKALPDNRAIVGLGAIRSQKAVEPLRKLLRLPNQSVDAAVALFKIAGDTDGIDAIIHTLKQRDSFWSNRMDAAIALRNFRIDSAVNALLAALDDPEALVRHHAAASLLALYKRDDESAQQVPTGIPIRIMREAERAAAAEELRRLVEEHLLNQL